MANDKFFPHRNLAWATILLSIAVLTGSAAIPAGTAEADVPFRNFSFRYYRATAYINILSITIFSRSDVGGGYASVEDTGQNGVEQVVMKFVSGSTPERAHGLNRLGLIQEVVRSHQGEKPESEYFGFMTASNEESFAQAKAALQSQGKGEASYVAAEGSSRGNDVRYAVKYMLKPSSYRWSNAGEFTRDVQADFFGGDPLHYRETHGDSAATFLYSVREAIMGDAVQSESRFMHNGKFFRMQTVKAQDKRIGGEFVKAGLTANAGGIVRLNGTIRNEKSGEETSFRLWFDKQSSNELPLRFEFRPKSYLKLQFDADPKQREPQDLVLLTETK
ncbi:MAG TPA: hypothetical protein VHZ07_20790 [Bryobacteraceae bacterium]|jgi:hypothetical protein|nr:hypothetical protein [Bryobacteraceae bacterium]